MSHDEDPLDLLEDDGDGVIDTILMLDEDEEKKELQARTGCLGLMAVIALPVPLIYLGLSLLQK